MAVYSKILELQSGSARTVDLSTNTLSVQGLQINAATGGGAITQAAHSATTSYTVVWPAAQAASSGYALLNDGAGNLSWSPASSGSVTSVALADGSTSPIYTISGSPVTSTGTLTFTLSTKSANTVFAGPASGSAAQPSFRALVSADIPSLSSIYLPLAGGTMSGAINMGGNKIDNMANPTLAQDAATKSYVDAAISGLTWQGPAKAYAASNVALTGGATLTIDGYSVQNGDLVILGNQTTASQNGEYTASGIGTAYTLTANGLPTAAGDAWLILDGTTYADSAFVATSAVPTAAFIEFAGPTAYSFTAPLQLSGNTVSITQASGSSNGYLSSTDWNTFNGKQAAGNYITALTGDVTASGPGSAAATLATVNSNVGTFASVTVNGKGLVTAAAALSGDATTSGAALTLATVNSNTGSFGSSTSIPSFTVNAKGLITAASGNAVVAPAGTLSGTTLNSTVVTSSLTTVGTIGTGTWQGTAIGAIYGGTSQTSYTTGDTLYASASNTLSKLGIGTTGQVLTVAGGIPSWASPATSGTVTSVSVVSANGLAGTVATATTTPAITLSTTITAPVLAGNGTAISAATTTGTGSTVVLSASPALTGTITAANLTLSGNLVVPVEQLTATYNGAATLTANTTYCLRWGIPANSETAGDLYLADWTTSSFDLFWVAGLYNSGTSTATGTSITITKQGNFTLGSSDTTFGSTDQGKPAWLGASGAFGPNSTFSPSTGNANFKLGIVTGSTTLWIDRQMNGVS